MVKGEGRKFVRLRGVPTLCGLVLLIGCAGTSTVTKRASANLVPASTITVVSRGVDSHNVQGQIEDILFRKGYNVVSETVARDQLKVKSDVVIEPGHGTVDTSVSHVKEVRSVYLFSFSYATRPDFPQGEVFTSFTGSIIDLRTGQLVASLRFSQGAFGSKSMTSALERMLKDL